MLIVHLFSKSSSSVIGELTLGGDIPDYYNGKLSYVDLVPLANTWQIPVNK